MHIILVKSPLGNWHLYLMVEGKFQGSLLCIACIALDIPRIVFLYSEFSLGLWYQQYKNLFL